MICCLKHTNNRLAGMHRLLVVITILYGCYWPNVEAVCESEVNNSLQVAQRIAKEWPLRGSRDNKTQYVQRIADLLVQTIRSQRQTRYFNWPLQTWRILLVRDLSVNAYSIGNGRVYLTDGTFDFVQNEAELVAIIAHEIAHQLLGHFCRYDERSSKYKVGSLVQIIDTNKEMEADTLAIEILQKANYPAQAMLDIVKRLPVLMHGSAYKLQRLKKLDHQLRGLKRTPFYSSPAFQNIKKLSHP